MKVSCHRVENELVRMGAQYLKQRSKFVPLVDLQLKHPPIMAQNLHDVCGYIEASWIEFPSKKRLHIVWQLLFCLSVCVLLDQKMYTESMMLYSLITPRQCIMPVPIGLSGVKVKVQVKILINMKLYLLNISYMSTLLMLS